MFDRCCIKGSLLEVNERLIKQPELLNSSVSTCFNYVGHFKIQLCQIASIFANQKEVKYYVFFDNHNILLFIKV